MVGCSKRHGGVARRAETPPPQAERLCNISTTVRSILAAKQSEKKESPIKILLQIFAFDAAGVLGGAWAAAGSSNPEYAAYLVVRLVLLQVVACIFGC
jgi:hypothetical protein